MTTAKCRAQGGPSACEDPDCPQRIAFYAALTAEQAPSKTTASKSQRSRVPWETRFQEFQTWVSTNGSMPRLISTDKAERRLAVWVSNQKSAVRSSNATKTLTVQQQALMTGLDPTWLVPQRNRNQQLDAQVLEDFLETHGRAPRPDASELTERALYAWATKQRTHGDSETKAVVSNLMPKQTIGRKGQASLNTLQDFMSEQGRAPRYDATDPKERALYVWASKQRTHGNPETKAAINRLLPKKKAGRAGGANLQQLRDFVATTGHSPRRSSPAGSLEYALHTWVSNQRRVNPDLAIVAELNRLVPKHGRGEEILQDYLED